MLNKGRLEERLVQVRTERRRLLASVQELTAQINALNGREVELVELIALIEGLD